VTFKGPSSGDNRQPPSFFSASVNRFAPLDTVVPEYTPLAIITVYVRFPGYGDWIRLRALIDSGCQGNFINEKLVQKYLMPQVRKSCPLAITLADGGVSRGGNVTHYDPVILKIEDHTEAIALDITTMPHDMILGIPCLDKHDPSISWSSRSLTFNLPQCLSNCIRQSRIDSSPLSSLANSTKELSPVLATDSLPPQPPVSDRADTVGLKKSAKIKSKVKQRSKLKTPPVSLIGAAAFSLPARPTDFLLGLLSLIGNGFHVHDYDGTN
jgi:hypothetical protein